MISDYLIYIIIFSVVGFFGYREFMHGPSPYRGRNCNGKAWKRAFPNSSNESIRLFLSCLVDGMGLSDKTKLKFHPNDQVIDIYRSLYGGKTPAGDNMECETFLENLSCEFSKDESELLKFWKEDVTLGQLYEYTTA